MTSQRRDARVSGALKVFETGDDTHPSVTGNISTSGILLITKKRWKLGTVVSLDLRHRYVDMTIRALVVHQQPEGVGLEFLEPSEEQQKKLEFVIESLLADGAWLDERRTKLRTAVGGPVVWRVGKTEVQSQLRDLSAGGAYIETPEPPEVGAQIYLYLPGKEGKEVKGCQATVMHRNADGFGVSFVFPTEEFLSAVATVMDVPGA